MAYRVTTEPANRARAGVSRRPDPTLSRNVTLASVALGCVCLAAAGVALLGRDRSPGSLPNYVASHKALKIAWVEPEYQAQFERNLNIAAKANVRIRTATAAPPAAPPQTAPNWIGRVPLPHARPRELMVAAIPLPRERAAEAGPAATQLAETLAEPAAPPEAAPIVTAALPEPSAAPAAEPETTEAAAAPEPVEQTPAETTTVAPLRPARPARLMSYAPTRDVIFDTDITGSIGNPLRELVAAAKHDVPLPAKPPHDKSSALKTKISPEPALKLAKPRHKPTPQEKLWGPVRVASLAPFVPATDSKGIPRAPYDRQTAVYVITEKKVYMPDGSVLEAHSGYGDKMDDPRFAHVRMRGVTPPHVYDLKMRERLFHGVEAIRMLPIGGEGAIFGRDGILAHTYMLGRTGQSNGCVSFKDYDEFLEAFKAGKVNRLAVIARLD